MLAEVRKGLLIVPTTLPLLAFSTLTVLESRLKSVEGWIHLNKRRFWARRRRYRSRMSSGALKAPATGICLQTKTHSSKIQGL